MRKEAPISSPLRGIERSNEYSIGCQREPEAPKSGIHSIHQKEASPPQEAFTEVTYRACLPPSPTPLGRGRTRDVQTHVRETQELLFSRSEQPLEKVNMHHLFIYDIKYPVFLKKKKKIRNTDYIFRGCVLYPRKHYDQILSLFKPANNPVMAKYHGALPLLSGAEGGGGEGLHSWALTYP